MIKVSLFPESVFLSKADYNYVNQFEVVERIPMKSLKEKHGSMK